MGMRWGLGPAAAKPGYYFHRPAQNSGEIFLPLLSKPPNTKKSPDPAGNKFLCASDNQVCSAGLCRGCILGPGFGDFLDLQSLWKVCSEPLLRHSHFQERFPGEEPAAAPGPCPGMQREWEAGGRGWRRDLLPSLCPSTRGTAPSAVPEMKGVTFAPCLALFGAPFLPLHPLGGNISLPSLPTPTFKAIPAPRGFENPAQSLQSGAAGGRRGRDGEKQGMEKAARVCCAVPRRARARAEPGSSSVGQGGQGRFWICWGWQDARPGSAAWDRL